MPASILTWPGAVAIGACYLLIVMGMYILARSVPEVLQLGA